MPLAVTLTIATAGAAAWVWSQRKDDDDDEHEPGLVYDNADYGKNPSHGPSRSGKPQQPPPQGPPYTSTRGDDTQSIGIGPGPNDPSAPGWGARMSGALRRTPSPQQFIEGAGKTVATGFAAAGAAMGKALASIREEDKYADNPWSEEADAKRVRDSPPGTKRKTVAIVVSADSSLADADHSSGGYHEHATLLSHIPHHNDFSRVKIFVLIYSPHMKENSLEGTTGNLPPPSLSSSISNIEHEQAQSPSKEKQVQLGSSPSSNAAFNAVFAQASAIVEKESMILPFTTPNGHVHILRHLQPEVVYLQESMAGDNGNTITTIQSWLRHDIILVVGAEGGSGGLADSESEAERADQVQKWWQKTERVGRGRGVVVVDGMRVNDDWLRRVQGRE